MADCRKELLSKLSPHPAYYEEMELIAGDQPPFVCNSLRVERIGDEAYGISHDFFQRSVCHVLSLNGETEDIYCFLNDHAHFDEVHTHFPLKTVEFSVERGYRLVDSQNLYGGLGSEIVFLPEKHFGLEFVQITADKIDLLDDLSDELTNCRFDSYDFLCQAITDGGMNVYAALLHGKCVGYVRLHLCTVPCKGRTVMKPTIFIASEYRNHGVGAKLLAYVIGNVYREFVVNYSADTKNMPSNRLAQKVGLKRLGTRYVYGKCE